MISCRMDNSLITYTIFEPFAEEVLAFTTTRSSLPRVVIPRFTGEPANNALNNRNQLAKLLKINTGQLVFPRQTHSCYVANLPEIPDQELKETDAMVTNRPGICLCIQTADCVPLLLYDPKVKAAGAVHAGWRGTVDLIAGKAVENMMRIYGSHPRDIMVAIGPSIGPDKYEVGNEVAEAVYNSIPFAEKSLRKSRGSKYDLDLWEANRQVLLSKGILPEHIEVSGRCTFSENDHFFSARREGIGTGRIVTGIILTRNGIS
jgi:polyphenol oxidase